MASCSVIVLLFAVALGLGLYFLEERAGQAWPPGGSFAQGETFQTSKGPVKLPILYFKGSLVGAFYLVDPDVAQQMIPDDLEPLVLPVINKAISGIFMFEYQNTTIGPYGEFGLTIQTRRKGSGATLIGYLFDMIAHVYKLPWMLNLHSSEDTGLYVVTLPVETENAKAGGVEIWGYPKYIAQFQSDFSKPDKMEFVLGNEFAFKMSRPSFGPTMAGLPFLTYTKLDGKLVRTVVEVGHKAQYGFANLKLDIIGTGPSADKMKKLGLDKASPVAAFRTDSLRAHLPRGSLLK